MSAVNEILSTDLTPAQLAPFQRAFESLRYPTTALLAFEAWLRVLDDDDGADMVHKFARKFAAHEAAQL